MKKGSSGSALAREPNLTLPISNDVRCGAVGHTVAPTKRNMTVSKFIVVALPSEAKAYVRRLIRTEAGDAGTLGF